jgi:hypothetical protein
LGIEFVRTTCRFSTHYIAYHPKIATTGSVLDAIIDRAGDVEEDAQNIIVQSKINADAYNDKARNAKNQKYMSMFSTFMRPF